MLWNRGKKRSQRISLLCERIRGPYNFFIRKAQGRRVAGGSEISYRIRDEFRRARSSSMYIYILHIMEETKLEMKELVR